MNATLQKIKNILQSKYDLKNYKELISELFTGISFAAPDLYIEASSNFKSHIAGYSHIGNYKTSDNKNLIVAAVELQKQTYVENARSTQRSFAKNLIEKRNADAAIIAFYTKDEPKWRLSFVRLDYEIQFGTTGFKTTEKLTPAKRYSYLVGENEPCHTALSRFNKLLITTADNHITLDELEEIFSVEKVTDEFFKLYCEKFHQLREQLESNENFKIEAQQHNFTAAQFAKKLLGQIVFLYFLQKKGWLGVKAWPDTLNEKEYKDAFFARGSKSRELIPIVYRPMQSGEYRVTNSGLNSISDEDEAVLATCVKGKPWGSGPHNFMRKLFELAEKRQLNFFDDLLEPLFYDALNVNRGEQGYCPALHCRIPFLSGGLFEPIDGYEWKYNNFGIKNELFSNKDKNGILDIFDRYNFTISEDEPLEREVAIDPEMLGKVFENLLEVQDRKSKGAFYTPREIVHYMCQESLVNYLTNTLQIDEQPIRNFILYGDLMKDEDTAKAKFLYNSMLISKELFLMDETGKVTVNRLDDMDKALQNIRVADPAVGSGAFPLGMLNEIVRARQNISAYKAITQNAYENRMMYQTDRAPWRLKYETIRNCIFAADIDPSAVDIAQLRLWLSLVIDDEINPKAESDLDGHRNPLPLPNLECNILCGNSLIDEIAGIKLINESELLGNTTVNTQIETAQSQIDTIIKKLIEKQDELYRCDNTNKKKQLKADIEYLRDEIIMLQMRGCTEEQIEKYRESKKMASKPYVLWQLDFAKVFREKGGFDVVIGNPPYFNVQTLGAKSPIVEILKNRYSQIWMDKSDILFYFCYLASEISCEQIAFITSNAYLFSDKAKKFRNYIVSKIPIFKIINFEKYLIFNSASITSCITFFKKNKTSNHTIALVKNATEKDLNLNQTLYNNQWFNVNFVSNSLFSLIPARIKNLNDKIKGNYELLGNLLKVGKGMETAANSVFLFNYMPPFPSKYIKRRITGNMINRYYLGTPSEYLLYYEYIDDFTNLDECIKKHLLQNRNILENRATVKNEGRPWWKYSRPMHKEYYKYDKIWCSYRAKQNIFALDTTSECIGLTNTVTIFDTNPFLNIKYILALINSKLLEYQHKNNAKQTGNGVFEYVPNTIERYPIPQISLAEQMDFITLIDKILDSKKHNPNADITYYEIAIDALVYKLYGLNNEEIKIVENSVIR